MHWALTDSHGGGLRGLPLNQSKGLTQCKVHSRKVTQRVHWRKDSCIPNLSFIIYKMRQLHLTICKVTTSLLLPFSWKVQVSVSWIHWVYFLMSPWFLFLFLPIILTTGACLQARYRYPISLCISVSNTRFWYILDAQWELTEWRKKLGNI